LGGVPCGLGGILSAVLADLSNLGGRTVETWGMTKLWRIRGVHLENTWNTPGGHLEYT